MSKRKELLWGFINEKGEIAIEPRFHDAGEFHEERAWVKIDYARGYINLKGEIVIPLIYTKTGDFFGGKAKVEIDEEKFYIDRDGQRIENLEENFPKAEEMTYPSPILIDNLFGYADRDGNIVIKPQFCEASPFLEGLARVKKTLKGKWSFINDKGEQVFKEKFIQAGNFHDGLAPVLLATEY